TIANTISGGGTLSKIGGSTVTLSGNNSAFAGTVSVAGGTLKVLGNSALGSTNVGTTVSSGGTLDLGLNSVNVDQEPLTISGSGVGGNGALINSSGNAGFLLSNFKNLILAADATIGGS